MSYEFVSLEDAGTSTGDIIMWLRWKPSQLRRWFGAEADVAAYYGQDAKWQEMDGLPARSRVRAVFESSGIKSNKMSVPTVKARS